MNNDHRRRLAAASLAECLKASGARRILVVATSEGHGVRTVADALAGPLQELFEAPVRWTDARHLDDSPPVWQEGSYHLVCGPAYGAGDVLLRASHQWRNWFDGAMVVVSNRRTERDDLKALAAWLRAVDTPPIGILYNDYGCLSASDRLRRLVWTMRQLFRRSSTPALTKAPS